MSIAIVNTAIVSAYSGYTHYDTYLLWLYSPGYASSRWLYLLWLYLLYPTPTRLRELKEAEDETGMRALEQLQLTLSEVERTWWDSLPETDREHQARVQEILTQVQYSP